MQAPTTITMVKVKSYYVPYDGLTAQVLRAHGIFNTRIKDDLFETVAKLKLRPHGIRGRVLSFTQDIEGPFLEKLKTSWLRIPGSKFLHRTTGNMVLSTVNPESYQRARLASEKVSRLLNDYFLRWGIHGSVNIAERNSLVKITVSQSPGMKDPVIPISKKADTVELQEPTLDFGFGRIRIIPDKSGISGSSHRCIVIMEHKTGDTYKVSQTSSALRSELKANNEFLMLAIRGNK